jgi:RNA polymerase sigma-70 factor (ECF subfamily)
MADSREYEEPKIVDDSESLRKIREGGKARTEGISEIYRKYARRMLGYYLRNRVMRANAEDLIQDVFVSVVRNCDQFKGESRIDVWIWSIVRNRLIDHVRQIRPMVDVDDEQLIALVDANDSLLHTDVPDGLVDCVRHGFDAFSRTHNDRAQTIMLAVVEGWSIEDLADFLKRTPPATREYLSQCRKKLRVFLEPCREFLTGS